MTGDLLVAQSHKVTKSTRIEDLQRIVWRAGRGARSPPDPLWVRCAIRRCFSGDPDPECALTLGSTVSLGHGDLVGRAKVKHGSYLS